MIVSHESPLCLLEKSLYYNDFDYILYHLIDRYEEYEKFVVKSKKENRLIIMDNSAYELFNKETGESDYDIDRFIDCIKTFKPDFFILPDKFNDSKETINLAKKFLNKYKNLNSFPLGVVQGETLEEYIKCYNFMKNNVEIIGINFMQEIYKNVLTEEEKRNLNEQEQYSKGRIKLLEILEKENVIDKDKYHHLLGIIFPQDIIPLKYKRYIKSVDTSNPVLHGMLNKKYIKFKNGYGLKEKIKIKMQDLMEKKITKNQEKIIMYNIEKFKENLI